MLRMHHVAAFNGPLSDVYLGPYRDTGRDTTPYPILTHPFLALYPTHPNPLLYYPLTHPNPLPCSHLRLLTLTHINPHHTYSNPH